MPWHVSNDDGGCPEGKPFAVIKDADGSVAGCHATEAEANAQVAALYANEDEMATRARTFTVPGPDAVAAVEEFEIYYRGPDGRAAGKGAGAAQSPSSGGVIKWGVPKQSAERRAGVAEVKADRARKNAPLAGNRRFGLPEGGGKPVRPRVQPRPASSPAVGRRVQPKRLPDGTQVAASPGRRFQTPSGRPTPAGVKPGPRPRTGTFGPRTARRSPRTP